VPSCASCHTHVLCTKAKDANDLVHLEVANVGTPLVSILVSRAVAKGLALAPIPRTLFAVAIGFESMKDCSGKIHDWVRYGSNYAPLEDLHTHEVRKHDLE